MSRPTAIQTAHLRLEEIDVDVVSLTGGRHRAVLEVGSINFGLQGEAEQELVVAGFAAFLNSLTFPVQILVRVLPVDLERYLSELQGRTRHLPDALSDLARDYVTFLQRLARNRTLLERRFYLVVPAQFEPSGPRRRRPFGQTQPMESLDGVRRQLTFRCEEIERQVGRSGLTARRLRSAELASLFYACWCPDLSRIQRLQRELEHATTYVVASPIREPRRP
jgi:hypothetical protein